MFKNVLVPLDRSQASESALTIATALAALGARRLTLVEVHHARESAAHQKRLSMAGMTVVVQDSAEAYLDRWASALRSARFEVDARHPTGDPAREILRAASATGADLIVMATHGRGALARVALGSVADAVTRAAPCPVVMVRAQPGAVRPPDATGEGLDVRTIVVPLDGSALAEVALEPVRARGKPTPAFTSRARRSGCVRRRRACSDPGRSRALSR
jgi:nucleotide-binding universal stress UspA family protein